MPDRLRPEVRFRPEAWLRALFGRRLLLGVGAAVLIGGWGTTRYAHEQQMMVPAGAGRVRIWHRSTEFEKIYLWSSNSIYGLGVTLMAVGAGLIGFTILPRAKGGER